MNSLTSSELMPGCSIALKCADDVQIVRCLDSIDDPTVSVNAVITPSARISEILEAREVPYSVTEYGNIAKSAQISVEEAEHDNVIVMDSDAFFAPGAIARLRSAMHTAVVAKPRIDYMDDGTRVSRLIASSRQTYNAIPNHATNPGLAFNRIQIEEACGYVFNSKIRWTEDTDLNYRLKRAGIDVDYVSDAVIIHDAVTLSHELKCAFLYGVGKRLSVEHTPERESVEELGLVLRAVIGRSKSDAAKKMLNVKEYDKNALSLAWRVLYLSGYHAQKHTGHWTVDS